MHFSYLLVSSGVHSICYRFQEVDSHKFDRSCRSQHIHGVELQSGRYYVQEAQRNQV